MRVWLVLLFVLSACANNQENFRRRNVDEYFTSSGVVQYFLPDLPTWADTVSSMQCRRESSVRFFDFEKMNSSFGLSYVQMLQMQLAFNIERNQKCGAEAMALTEEERLFYATSERVQAGIVPFKIPTFKRLHVVLVDAFVQAEVYRDFYKLINSSEFSNGLPIFASLCYNDATVREFLEKTGFKGSYEVIPSSMFSPFSAASKLGVTPGLNLAELLGSEKKIILYIPKGIEAPSINGASAVKSY